MFQLRRYFSIASLAVFGTLYLLINFGVPTLQRNLLNQVRATQSRMLAQTVANFITVNYGDFVQAGQPLNTLLSDEMLETLDASIAQLIADADIDSVQVINAVGDILYASDHRLMGNQYDDTARIRAILASAQPIPSQQDRVLSEDESGNVSTMIALDSGEAVLDLHSDLSEIINAADRRILLLRLNVIWVLAALFGILYFIVRHADIILKQQHSDIQEKVQELKTINEQLVEANHRAEESTRLKSEFLSTMSHELRTPLNAIIGYSAIITGGILGKLDQKTVDMVQRIEDSGQHLLLLINNILDISKIEAGRMTIVRSETRVEEMVETVVGQLSILAQKKGLAFHRIIDDNVPKTLMIDGDRVQQIMINLLSNAVKFTEDGAITLHLSYNIEADETAELHIDVQDTGIGIPPHSKEYIFDEFRQVDGTSTRNHDGTGLGLAIVRKFAEAMDGRVQVESTVGQGSTFSVQIPTDAVSDVAVIPSNK